MERLDYYEFGDQHDSHGAGRMTTVAFVSALKYSKCLRDDTQTIPGRFIWSDPDVIVSRLAEMVCAVCESLTWYLALNFRPIKRLLAYSPMTVPHTLFARPLIAVMRSVALCPRRLRVACRELQFDCNFKHHAITVPCMIGDIGCC